jgi:hypothetical protein
MAPAKPLTWNEIRSRAHAFVAEWRGETRERAEAQTFWNDWFHVFGINRRRVAVFEQAAERLSTKRRGSIDAFWPSMLVVEHKSAGESLEKAEGQALDYLGAMPDDQLPRMVISSDFGHFRVLDLEAREETHFSLEEFPDRLEMFGFIAGYERRLFRDEHAVNVEAAQLMGKLFDELKASGYQDHALTMLLVRILFLLFADDTGIWERDLFVDYIRLRTQEDGRDVGLHLNFLFQVLNTREPDRQRTLDEDLARFPYINGGLFAEVIAIPAFDASMRKRLLECCHFDWSGISPAVFGSIFQSVMDGDERRQIGGHYTTDANIQKVIGPLFLDDLKAELQAANSGPKLQAFRDKLAGLHFLDPACGCGNFLVISYRELRALELAAISRQRERNPGQQVIEATALSTVTVDQFYGMEIDEWPARIAETAMYLVDHQANRRLSAEFGLYYARFPIATEAHIHVCNALRSDWNEIIAAHDCSYILGNPPFVGKQHRTDPQQDDMDYVFGGARGTGNLDYVAAWYRKAIDYMAGSEIRAAFVSTNSIVQGEQVPALWPLLLDAGYEIDFAHRTFAWTSEARGRAAVHVVIIGFSRGGLKRPKLLFDHPQMAAATTVIRAQSISPYLVDGPVFVVSRRSTPLAQVPSASFGSMPNDGGSLILTPEERDQLLIAEPSAGPYVAELLGAEELINGSHRYCLWLGEAEPAELRQMPEVMRRVECVRAYRMASRRVATRQLAELAYRFGEIRQPRGAYLCLPRHSSENRRYIPMVFVGPEIVAHDSTLTVEGADLYLFGVLSSEMFMTWVRAVAGRLESRYRLSVEMVYNTFPWPEPSPPQRKRVSDAAAAVQVARSSHPASSLADQYDSRSMPVDLLLAHRVLDRAVATLYGRNLDTELAKQAALFKRWAQLTGLLV